MTIDRYRPCPCGSGKKIKFCCSADIVHELEKIQRMLEGDQRLACLDHVNHLLTKYPDRPSLLSVKALLENELGQTENAQQTIGKFLETTPDSPVALAEQARLLAGEGKAVEAVAALQKAITAADGKFPMRVHGALAEVGGALLEEGRILSARAHFLLHASLGGEEDPRGVEILMELNSTPQLPLLLKQDMHFGECDAAAPYKAEFDAALQLVGRAAWQAGLEKLEALAQKQPEAAPVARNIAILRGFLADDAGAREAWRRYSTLAAEKSLDDAVEAEALSQLLHEGDDADYVKAINFVYPVTDTEKLMEVLLGSRRVMKIPMDPGQLSQDGSPPPKGLFSLLNREMPASGKELTLDTVPESLGELFVYGRQTDRPARLEITFTATENLDQRQQALKDVAGGLIEEASEQEDVDDVSRIEEAMTWNWRLPSDTPADLRARLTKEKRRQILFEVWPNQKFALLDGKTPAEAAGDAAYRLRLLGAILLLELNGHQNRWQIDFNEVRGKLGLPKAGTIDPWKVDVDRLPLVRFHRLDAVKMKPEKLIKCFQQAVMMHAVAAIRLLGLELVGHSNLDGKVNKANVYGALSRVAVDADEALSFIDKAREECLAKGESPAPWLLAELHYRIQLRNVEAIQRIVNQIQTKHATSPAWGRP